MVTAAISKNLDTYVPERHHLAFARPPQWAKAVKRGAKDAEIVVLSGQAYR
jgi:hypothetical protein